MPVATRWSHHAGKRHLAAAVALGFNPSEVTVEAEFTKAMQLCPDQPLVHAAYAKVRLAFDTRPWRPGAGDNAEFHIGRVGEEASALAAARNVERLFPTHPLGYATEATILLEVADKYGQAGRHPFTVRAMYERSLALLDAVSLAQPDDPTVGFGRARALAGLGRTAEAVSLAVPLLAEFHDRDARYGRDSVRSMYLDLGRSSDAVDLMSTPDGSTDSLDYEAGRVSYMRDATCLSLFPFGDAAFRGAVGDPEPGWGGNCYVAFIDATGNQYPGGADALDYVNYIPLYRREAPDREVLLVAAGRMSEVGSEGWGADALRVAEGRWAEVRPGSLSTALEHLQDAYRRIGELAKAEELLRRALESGYGDPSHTADRLGEVMYLQGDYAQAVEQFRHAAASRLDPDNMQWRTNASLASAGIGSEWSTVKLAVALYQMGDMPGAERALSDPQAAPPATELESTIYDPTFLAVARSTLLGTMRLKSQKYETAVVALRDAVTACQPLRSTDLDPCVSGVQYNNLAVALLRSGDPAEAAAVAQDAIAQDPHNPMFVEALANALEEAGRTDQAIEVYNQAIAFDATQATAHNNLGVLLAQSGHADQAQQSFISAVRAQPHYGAAWVNLGVSFAASSDPLDLLRSQGALARAAQVSPAFRGAELEWFPDRAVYDPKLDLSKPLPKDWSAGEARQATPLGIAAIVLAILTLALRHLITDKLQSAVIDRSFSKMGHHVALKRAGIGDLAAGAVCVTAIAYYIAASLGDGPWPTLTGVSLGLLITSIFLSVRQVLAPTTEHGLSIPGTLVACGGAVIGVPFVPVPVLGAANGTRTRWAPYVVLGVLILPAALLAWMTAVPVLRLTFDVLTVSIASGLIAIAPLDGAHLSARVSRLAAILLVAAALALALHWI